MKCLPCRHLTKATLSLCLAAATHSFLLFSFFPYAGYMAVALIDNNGGDVTLTNVGIYAGMLGATFTFGRFVGFLPWKFVRNLLGGKRALVASLLLTGLASLWVGCATTFSGALVARFVQGLSNCISGCVKRAAINLQYNAMRKRAASARSIGEDSILTEDETREGNPQALVLSIMWWGTALGPVVGGLLSDPRFLRIIFGLESESELGWYGSRPYLLPNLCGAILCWISMFCTAFFVENPPPVPASQREDSLLSISSDEERPLLTPAGSVSTRTATMPNLWSSFVELWNNNRSARYHLDAYWSFSFAISCCDEALPLFMIVPKKAGGIGLSQGQVGAVLSAAGLIVAIGHHMALGRLMDVENGSKNGMYRILSISAVLGSAPNVLVPVSLVLNGVEGSTEESLLGVTSQAFVFLVALIVFTRGAMDLYFSYIGIVTGRTLRVVHKDEVAHIMTLGALFVRSLASLAAGGVLSLLWKDTDPETLSLRPFWNAWITIGLVFGMVASAMTIVLARWAGDGMLTRKQREYIAERLKRIGLVGTEWDGFHESAKTVFFRWIRSTFRDRAETRKGVAPEAGGGGGIDGEPGAQALGQPLPRRRMRWSDHVGGPGVDFDSAGFFVLGTHGGDVSCTPHVLTPPLLHALQKHLPQRHSESNFWLRYSLLRDGATLHALEAKSGLGRFSILAIETLGGDVLGCFMTKPWVPSNNQYRHSGESFLWRMTRRRLVGEKEEEGASEPLVEVFPSTGANELSQLVTEDRIACGGGVVNNKGDGFGILLDGDLQRGSTSPCATYGNPLLLCCEDNGDAAAFEVANVEVWAVTPYLFVADAERSEKELLFLRENSRETPSSASQWSHFL